VVGETIGICITREVWGLSLSMLLLLIWDMGFFKGVLWSVAIEKCLGRPMELTGSEIKRS
jgi:hypothetical protein